MWCSIVVKVVFSTFLKVVESTRNYSGLELPIAWCQAQVKDAWYLSPLAMLLSAFLYLLCQQAAQCNKMHTKIYNNREKTEIKTQYAKKYNPMHD